MHWLTSNFIINHESKVMFIKLNMNQWQQQHSDSHHHIMYNFQSNLGHESHINYNNSHTFFIAFNQEHINLNNKEKMKNLEEGDDPSLPFIPYTPILE